MSAKRISDSQGSSATRLFLHRPPKPRIVFFCSLPVVSQIGLMSDAQQSLLDRAIQGDTEALTRLLEGHAPAVRRRLRRRIGGPYRAALDEDDVLQVTYLEAFLRIRLFEPNHAGSLEAWLHRIADNNLRDAIKELDRAKRPPRQKQLVPAGQDSYATLLEHLGTTTTPSSHAGRNEAKQLLEDALAKLPADYAAVVRMMDLEGRSGPETAQVLGRSRGAVHMLRARAHDCLKDLLGAATKFLSEHR